MRGRFGRSSPRHFQRRPRRILRLRSLLVVLAVIVVLAAAAVGRAETEIAPALKATRVLAASVQVPGPAPVLAWPAHGEAAVEVTGVGSLGTSGPDTPIPIASLAKVMTAYVVLRDHPLGAGQPGIQITVTASDVADYQRRLAGGESVVAVEEGETLGEMQLLEALLVASGNNIAALIATHDAGSQAAFVAKMNSAARDLGMARTTYTGPSGVDATTVSTAADQLRLAAAAMSDPVFAQVVAMPSADLPVAGTVTNFNRLLGTDGFVGIKTGSDPSAGGCVAFADRRSVAGRAVTIVGVVLGQDVGDVATATLTSASLAAASALEGSVATSISLRDVLPAGTIVETVVGSGGRPVQVSTTSPLEWLGWGGLSVPLTVTSSGLGRTVDSGKVVATVTAGSGPVVSTPARATSSVPSPTLGWRLRHLI